MKTTLRFNQVAEAEALRPQIESDLRAFGSEITIQNASVTAESPIDGSRICWIAAILELPGMEVSAAASGISCSIAWNHVHDRLQKQLKHILTRRRADERSRKARQKKQMSSKAP